MKTLLLTLIGACILYTANGQAFLGLTGAQNTICDIQDNPGFALHDDRAQLCVASAGAMIGGNSFYFKPSIFSFLDSGKISAGNSFIKNNSPGQKSVFGFVEAKGPGAAFRIKKKYSVAVTTGIRFLLNSDNLDASTFDRVGAGSLHDTLLHDSFKVNNFALAAQVFSEINLTYAGYLYQSEDYNLTGGLTIKVLAGIGAVGLGVPQASYKTYNNDGTAYNTTGTANVAFTPYANKWLLSNNPFNAFTNAAGNLGVGADVGLIYYANKNEKMHLVKGYHWRIAASVTDIGSISYTASATSGSYSVNNKNINYSAIQNNKDETFGNRIFNDYLADTILQAKSEAKKFTVGLPTAFHLNVDMKVDGDFYLNGNLLLNLRKPSADGYTSHYITTLTLTPRYLHNGFGIGMPFSFNAINQGYLGAVLYVRSFYIGSASVFNVATADAVNTVSIYTGLNLRIKYKDEEGGPYLY